MPVGAPTFSEALRCGTEIFHSLKSALHKAGLSTAVGDEGGFAPNIASAREALDFILRSVESAGIQGRDATSCSRSIAPRPSSSRTGSTSSKARDGASRRPKWRLTLPNWPTLIRSPRSRTGWARTTWKAGRRSPTCIGNRVQLVGDDLFVTNEKRLAQGIENGIANSILVKVNQIGTLTETINAVRLAQTLRLHGGDVAPVGRDRGFDDCRPGGRVGLRADQDGQPRAVRPDGEVQPASADRGRAWRYSALSGDCGTEGIQARLIHRIIHQRAIFPCLPEAFMILKNPMGGACSQFRTHAQGVLARARAHRRREFRRLCGRRAQWLACLGRLSPRPSGAEGRAGPARGRESSSCGIARRCSIRARPIRISPTNWCARDLGLVRPDEVIVPLD